MLPPPASDTPDARAARVEGATTAAAALHPADAFEARLAARIIAMDAHTADCLRLAGLATADPAEMRRCRAQATSMARQAESALRSLLRIQAIREKQEAAMHPAAMERAGYWFRDASVPAPAPPPDPAAAPQAATQPEPAPTDPATEAERYAVIYPDRAARIRAAGGLPARLDFGPPEPDIVAALLRNTGHSPLGTAERPSHNKRHGLANAHSETHP
jgi:hypothetical protein